MGTKVWVEITLYQSALPATSSLLLLLPPLFSSSCLRKHRLTVCCEISGWICSFERFLRAICRGLWFIESKWRAAHAWTRGWSARCLTPASPSKFSLEGARPHKEWENTSLYKIHVGLKQFKVQTVALDRLEKLLIREIFQVLSIDNEKWDSSCKLNP